MTDSPANLPPLEHVRDERGVHYLTLNRPATFNALSEEMLAALQAALEFIALDESGRVAVFAARVDVWRRWRRTRLPGVRAGGCGLATGGD